MKAVSSCSKGLIGLLHLLQKTLRRISQTLAFPAVLKGSIADVFTFCELCFHKIYVNDVDDLHVVMVDHLFLTTVLTCYKHFSSVYAMTYK